MKAREIDVIPANADILELPLRALQICQANVQYFTKSRFKMLPSVLLLQSKLISKKCQKFPKISYVGISFIYFGTVCNGEVIRFENSILI